MTDEIFMRRALELAARGIGHVSTNPVVGCVIVKDGQIIGDGFHQKFGGPHAEVNAVGSVDDAASIPGSTVYVTLEPCSHHGKTPPCTDLLIGQQVSRIVIASSDPNPQVNGKGIARLKENGIEVETGILANEERHLNRRFHCFHKKKRPYVILKWAQTKDRFMARKNYDSKWISNENSRQIVHKWRTEEDAILVGFNTVKYDNPSLTARDWVGKNPLRLILDPDCALDLERAIFQEPNRTLIFNELKNESHDHLNWIKVPGMQVLDVLKTAYEVGIQSILVEGGAATLRSFIQSGLWDEARIFISDQNFGEGIRAPGLEQDYDREETIFGDRLLYYSNDKKRKSD